MTRKIASFVFAVALPLTALDNLPSLKEGLWSITTETVNTPGDSKLEGSSSICRNHAYDDKARAHAKTGMKGCTVTKETMEGNTYTQVSHCEMQGRIIDSTAVTTSTADTAVHTESHTLFKPALAGRDETTLIMDQKYVGACPAGMEAGDRMDKDGKIIHINKPNS